MTGTGPSVFNSIAFLDGTRLLTPPSLRTEDAKNAFSVWNISNGQVSEDVAGPLPYRSFRDNEARIFAVSADGSMVAVVTSLLPGQPVTLYSTANWTVLDQIPMGDGPAQPNAATALSFFSKRNTLAIGTFKGTIELHDTARKGSAPKVLRAYDPRFLVPIGALASSPDDKYLATGAGLVLTAYQSLPAFKLWRVEDGSLLRSDLPAAMPVRQISWSHQAAWIAVAAGDRTVRLTLPDSKPNVPWSILTLPAPVLSLAFSPIEDRLAVAADSITFFDVGQGKDTGRK